MQSRQRWCKKRSRQQTKPNEKITFNQANSLSESAHWCEAANASFAAAKKQLYIRVEQTLPSIFEHKHFSRFERNCGPRGAKNVADARLVTPFRVANAHLDASQLVVLRIELPRSFHQLPGFDRARARIYDDAFGLNFIAFACRTTVSASAI